MNLDMHPEVRLEFREAIIYYEDCREGLGLEFSREIYESINSGRAANDIFDSPEKQSFSAHRWAKPKENGFDFIA